MPVIAGRTRAQLRLSVGYNLGAVYASSASAAGNAGGTTLIDNTLSAANDDYNGRWVIFTSGGNSGNVRYVSDYTGSTTTIILRTAATGQVTSGMTYELWDGAHNPAKIHDLLNQAILGSYRVATDPEEDVSLRGDGVQARFDIPPEFSTLYQVEYRSHHDSIGIHALDATFTETTNANLTQTADTQDKKQGAAALRIVAGASVANGNRITHAITSLNLAKYTHVEGWVKAAVTLAAGDFRILLDNGVAQGDSTDLELLAVPATVAAYTWTPFRIALANPRLDTAIISVGLQYNANAAANTVWFDDLRATVEGSEIWEPLHNREWSVDREARDLILTVGGRNRVGTGIIKLIGGGEPLLLTAEGTVNEVDDWYVIARTTELALASIARPRTEVEDRALAYWQGEARRARQGFPILSGVRSVE